MLLGVLSWAGSAMFIAGSFVKTSRNMRIFYLIGAIVLCCVFAGNGLNNLTNLSQFVLNLINICLHVWNLIFDKIPNKRRNYKNIKESRKAA